MLSAFEDSGNLMLGTLGEILTDTVVPVLWVIVPMLQIACITLGIIAAINNTPTTIRTTRAIMLTFKIGLIPFFIIGGIMIAVFLVVGLHPVLAMFGWGLAAFMGILGWLTLITGSAWSIATAVQLRRLRQIGTGEMAAHIVLQLFFVADVIDAIVLFSRSKSAGVLVPAQPVMEVASI